MQNLEGLDGLENLSQLWISGNQIEEIKVSLDKLVKLTDLNISGNKICSFKEALNLNRLPNLKILGFYDPHFGENPICNLCNYQVHTHTHTHTYTLTTITSECMEKTLRAPHTRTGEKGSTFD